MFFVSSTLKIHRKVTILIYVRFVTKNKTYFVVDKFNLILNKIPDVNRTK